MVTSNMHLSPISPSFYLPLFLPLINFFTFELEYSDCFYFSWNSIDPYLTLIEYEDSLQIQTSIASFSSNSESINILSILPWSIMIGYENLSLQHHTLLEHWRWSSNRILWRFSLYYCGAEEDAWGWEALVLLLRLDSLARKFKPHLKGYHNGFSI